MRRILSAATLMFLAVPVLSAQAAPAQKPAADGVARAGEASHAYNHGGDRSADPRGADGAHQVRLTRCRNRR